jgi:hypothetical protein
MDGAPGQMDAGAPSMMSMARRVGGALAVACVLVLCAPLSAPAGNNGTLPSNVANEILVGQIQTQLKIAASHAGQVTKPTAALSAVQLQLHGVLNCLEGPQGAYFNPAAGYPCQGQGDGIIPDLEMAVLQNLPGADSALGEVRSADTLAQQTVAATDPAKARSGAAAIEKHLQTANKFIGE